MNQGLDSVVREFSFFWSPPIKYLLRLLKSDKSKITEDNNRYQHVLNHSGIKPIIFQMTKNPNVGKLGNEWIAVLFLHCFFCLAPQLTGNPDSAELRQSRSGGQHCSTVSYATAWCSPPIITELTWVPDCPLSSHLPANTLRKAREEGPSMCATANHVGDQMDQERRLNLGEKTQF